MKKATLSFFTVLAVIVSIITNASAQESSTPPASSADLEALYTATIESRAADILALLNLTNDTQSVKIHDIIIAQYRVLKARDAFIDAKLKAEGKEINYSNRSSQIAYESKSLHDQFIANLSTSLTPAQVEIVKNKMTYNKVKVTYDAYCAIVPDLTETDKAKILESLKAAREEAMDGGSAPEKAAIFQTIRSHLQYYCLRPKFANDWKNAVSPCTQPDIIQRLGSQGRIQTVADPCARAVLVYKASSGKESSTRFMYRCSQYTRVLVK